MIQTMKPKIGDYVTVRGIACRIIKIHPFGTLDVQAPDGRCWRVSGLSF